MSNKIKKELSGILALWDFKPQVGNINSIKSQVGKVSNFKP